MRLWMHRLEQAVLKEATLILVFSYSFSGDDDVEAATLSYTVEWESYTFCKRGYLKTA